MSSSISFGGKCATVLVGAGLSWLTVSNPEIDRSIGKLFGTTDATLASADANMPSITIGGEADLDAPLFDVVAETDSVTPNAPGQGAPAETATPKRQNVQEMASQLRSLGASYLLLERLPQQTGDQFRARCDLAASSNSVKCCFEAVRDTPEQAMAEVLQAVVAAQGSDVRTTQTGRPQADSNVASI